LKQVFRHQGAIFGREKTRGGQWPSGWMAKALTWLTTARVRYPGKDNTAKIPVRKIVGSRTAAIRQAAEIGQEFLVSGSKNPCRQIVSM
jgi:hypothetical protein